MSAEGAMTLASGNFIKTEARAQHYHPAIKAFHWLVAVPVFTILPLGFLQMLVKPSVYGDINFWHVNLGFLLFWLMLARLCARFLTHTTARPAGIPAWQANLAAVNHWLLYLALIGQTILGFLVTNAQGFPLTWFNVIPVWSPIGKSPAAGALLVVHHYLAWGIVALIALHICGALYHRVIRRDDTLARIT
jgi:cytochrome b561